LGDIASISIGAVTGCNSVFLLTDEERRASGIGFEDVQLIVSRARHVEGIRIAREDLVRLSRVGEKTWILTPRTIEERGSAVRKRLAKITKYQRRTTCWMIKRDPWWRIETGPDCDGVFTYMNDRGPRLAVTATGIICTNTLHRTVFFPTVSEIDKITAS